jgi:hypothetical protein
MTARNYLSCELVHNYARMGTRDQADHAEKKSSVIPADGGQMRSQRSLGRLVGWVLAAVIAVSATSCESFRSVVDNAAIGVSKAVGGPRPDNSDHQQDVSSYRTAGPSPRATKVPAALSRAVTENPIHNSKELVQFLVAEETDPFQALKNIHDWIALTISYDDKAFFSNSIPNQEPGAVLSSKKAVCAGYAGLFQRFCTLAGIRCTTVRGYSRGYGYDPLVEETIAENHDWNAIKIGEAWYLVDVTWDSGHIYNGRFRREYSTDCFLLPAEQMIYTHLPTNPAWQMLPVQVSNPSFKALPYLEGRFFKYRFSGYTELQRVYSCNGQITVTLSHAPGIRIMAELFEKGERAVPHSVFVQSNQIGTDVLIRPQNPGSAKLRVFAGERSSRSLDHVWSVGVTAVSVVGMGYPEQFASYQAFGCKIISPLEAPLRVGQIVEFDLLANTEEILVVAGSIRRKYLPNSEGRFVFSVEVPRTDKLEVFARELKQNRYTGLLQYRISVY